MATSASTARSGARDGKRPIDVAAMFPEIEQIRDTDLKAAVQNEQYEEAAQLRDKIQKLEAEMRQPSA